MPQAQGSLASFKILMESVFNTAHTATSVAGKSKKVYFSSESLAYSRSQEQSKVMRGGTRHPTTGIAGTTDINGNIATELMATTPFWYAALGSVEVANTGGTMGSDLTVTAATINTTAQTMVCTKSAHGLVVGDSVEIAALTAPTSLNGLIFPVIDVSAAGDTFTLRIPMDTGSTYTKGSGTFKKVGANTTKNIFTYKAGGNIPSYIIEKGFSDITTAKFLKYTGCKCGSLSFTVNPSGIIELSTTWMGAQEAVGAASFDTGSAVDNTKVSFDASMLAAADVKIGGSANAYVKSMQFQLDNGLDGDTFVLGGAGVRAGINTGVYQITGSVNMVFESTTLYEIAKASTESSLDVTFKRGTGDGTAGNEYIQIVVPELTFTPKAPAVNGPGGVMVDLAFTGYYSDSASGTGMKVVIGTPQLPGALL